MAKVFIEETTLTAIGDAIRGKTGKTELIDPANMSTEIASISAGGGDIEVDPVVLTGICNYGCSGALPAKYIELFGDTVSTKDITTSSYMFYKSTLSSIPFEINFASSASPSLGNMFSGCENLMSIPDMTFSPSTYHDCAAVFVDCRKLENVPYLYNAYPSGMNQLFSGCHNIRNIPDDYFNTWNTSRLLTYNYANVSGVFNSCYSLRTIPSSYFEAISDCISTAYSNLYYNTFYNCHCVEDIIGVNVSSATLTSNAFSNFVNNCYRLKRLTFATNEDGTPKTAKWKAQTIDLTSYVGYANYSGSSCFIVKYNSGITIDSEIKYLYDSSFMVIGNNYEELKNHPDAWASHMHFSRYNHDSAVETINSLPDTSAYLATAGGTNTIKFKGVAGRDTDGGDIDTLTAEEIAVATAKGWTVTLV